MNMVPTLLSGNIVLTAVKGNDYEVLYHIMRDDGVKKYLPEFYEIIKSYEDFISVMDSFDVLWEKRMALIWGIYRADTLIGFIAILDIPQKATIFYSVGNNYRNTGVGKQSVALVIDYIKDSDLTETLYSEVFEENKASIEVLKSNGFSIIDNNEDKIIFSRKLKKF